MPYTHFTEEQKRQANAINLAEFLYARGEPLVILKNDKIYQTGCP